MSKKRTTLSVIHDIQALALINIEDIFQFVLTAKDAEIEKRYDDEANAIRIAEKYLDIALRVGILEERLAGWSMTYSQPLTNSDDRVTKKACFYDVHEEQEDAP